MRKFERSPGLERELKQRAALCAVCDCSLCCGQVASVQAYIEGNCRKTSTVLSSRRKLGSCHTCLIPLMSSACCALFSGNAFQSPACLEQIWTRHIWKLVLSLLVLMSSSSICWKQTLFLLMFEGFHYFSTSKARHWLAKSFGRASGYSYCKNSIAQCPVAELIEGNVCFYPAEAPVQDLMENISKPSGCCPPISLAVSFSWLPGNLSSVEWVYLAKNIPLRPVHYCIFDLNKPR